MQLRRLRHLNAANLMSALALVVAVTTGTAYALSVTGRDVRDGSLTSADVRNGTLRGIDVAQGSLPAGKLTSQARAAMTDTSPWETIPSGQLVVGSFGQTMPATTGTGGIYTLHVPLPALTPVNLTDAAVGMDAALTGMSSDTLPGCSGSSMAPIAPPGVLCIYLYNVSMDATGVTGLAALDGANTGFLISWVESNVADGSSTINGTWAYRAP